MVQTPTGSPSIDIATLIAVLQQATVSSPAPPPGNYFFFIMRNTSKQMLFSRNSSRDNFGCGSRSGPRGL